MTAENPRNPGKKHAPSDRLTRSETVASNADYKIGPGRPPKEHQFKPGQSGNPKGAKRRPRSLLPDLKAIFDRAFSQTVKVTQGERERLITLWDAGMQQLARQFAKGDRYARRDAFWIAEKLGSEFLTSRRAFDDTLASDRQAILDAYVERQNQQTVSAAHSPVLAPPELLDDDTPNDARGK
jgi:hypothetical protein